MNVVQKYTIQELDKAVKESYSWAEVHRRLRISQTGASTKGIRSRCDNENLDYSHFTGKSGDMPKRKRNKIPLSEILVEGSTYDNKDLKVRLLKIGLLKNICYECGLLPEWNGKPLVLQMDHINGDNTDNRLSNLRMLDPNCHTQTETFSSRNSSVEQKANFCLDCDEPILLVSTRCKYCAIKVRERIVWPCVCKFSDYGETYTEMAENLKVARITVMRRLKNHECGCDLE